MAGGGDLPARGGKRRFDFSVNLIPTIDLLSVLISFLLITAVWSELARINVSQVLPRLGEPGPTTAEQDPLYVFISTEDISLGSSAAPPTRVTGAPAELLPRFREAVKAYAQGLSAADRAERKVIVAATDGVAYDRLVSVLDIMLDSGLTQVSVGDAQGVKARLPQPG